ncbi:hypothetical protein J2W51_001917 [Tardiphaga robiniae]|jgi:hypothetical protein|nr:hypothetical protein [Tardiphaga robiniae]
MSLSFAEGAWIALSKRTKRLASIVADTTILYDDWRGEKAA